MGFSCHFGMIRIKSLVFQGVDQIACQSEATHLGNVDFSKFWTTYDNSKSRILNYLDGRYPSAAVEGINHKARVITKRCYGVKSAETLFGRLILDLNRAWEAAGRSIGELRQIAAGPKAVFLAFCTQNRKSRILSPRPDSHRPDADSAAPARPSRRPGRSTRRDVANEPEC